MLDDAAHVHHYYPVGDIADNRQVMREKKALLILGLM
jgi:hypothetical protein